MANTGDMRNVGTQFQYKILTGDTYSDITGCTAKKVPKPVATMDEVTLIEGPCIKQQNQIPDYGNLELEILFDDDDDGHADLEAAVLLDDDIFFKYTLPSGVSVTFEANVFEFSDVQGDAKKRQRVMLKAHCNTAPVPTAAS